MAVQLITYTPNSSHRNYNDLIDDIKELGDWCKISETVWIAETSLNTLTLRDKLKKHIGIGDQLAVITMAGDWSTQNFSNDINNWLRNHL